MQHTPNKKRNKKEKINLFCFRKKYPRPVENFMRSIGDCNGVLSFAESEKMRFPEKQNEKLKKQEKREEKWKEKKKLQKYVNI